MIFRYNKLRFNIFILFFFSITVFCFKSYSQSLSEWQIFNSSNSPLNSNNIYDIAVDNLNNKWIAAGGELLKITGDDFTDFSNWSTVQNLPGSINFIEADQSGNLWMGDRFQNLGLIKYDGNDFTIYDSQNSPLPYDAISGLAVDLNNNIWIMDGVKDMTTQIYLIEFDPVNNSWFQFPGNFGYQTSGDLAGIDSSDNIWTATEFKLTKVNTLTHDITEWNTSGLGQYVTQVKNDFKGNTWIAGGSAGWGGLMKFDGQYFTQYMYYAYSLAVDDQKNVWVGTEGIIEPLKLLEFNGVNWIEFTPANSDLPNSIRISNLQFDHHGNLWIATSDSGIAVFNSGGLITPVELTSFTYGLTGNNLTLSWTTSTEINNKGFEIQRATVNQPDRRTNLTNGKTLSWKTIGFVDGNGTSTEFHSYSFIDKNFGSRNYVYRLKQVDFNGSFEYSKEIEVNLSAPEEFSLEQNYPNPFNPITNIEYRIPDKEFISLRVYDILGNEISTLINEEIPAGKYSVKFDGKNLPSGIYIYRITSGKFSESKKLILLK